MWFGSNKESKNITDNKNEEGVGEVNKGKDNKGKVNKDKDNKVIVREILYYFKYDDVNWCMITYTDENNDKKEAGYMNEIGEITTDYPIKSYRSTANTFKLYDENGDVTFSSEEDSSLSKILCKYNDIYLIEREITSIDEKTHYVGFINGKGEWIFEPYVLSENYPGIYLSNSVVCVLEDGIIGCYLENNLFLFDSNSGECFVVDNIENKFWHYYNGQMIVQNSGKGISSVDKKGQKKNLLESESILLGVSENGFLASDNYYLAGNRRFYSSITFYNMEGNEQWIFDKYPIRYCELYEDYIFVELLGIDKNIYVGCINKKTGDLEYEPFKEETNIITSEKGISSYIGEKYILSSDANGYVCLKDITTGLVNVSLDIDKEYLNYVVGFENGLFIFNKRDSEDFGCVYSFYNTTGEEIVPHMKWVVL